MPDYCYVKFVDDGKAKKCQLSVKVGGSQNGSSFNSGYRSDIYQISKKRIPEFAVTPCSVTDCTVARNVDNGQISRRRPTNRNLTFVGDEINNFRAMIMFSNNQEFIRSATRCQTIHTTIAAKDFRAMSML